MAIIIFARSSDTQCLEEILKRLISGNVSQKRNAVDFISDLIHVSMESDTVLPPTMWYAVAFYYWLLVINSASPFSTIYNVEGI